MYALVIDQILDSSATLKVTLLTKDEKECTYFLNVAPFANRDSKYSIINGPPIFAFFETLLHV